MRSLSAALLGLLLVAPASAAELAVLTDDNWDRLAPAGKEADAISLEGVPAGCNAAFAGFWWSHVKKSALRQFVANLARRLEPGAIVAILDNAWAPGSSTPISRTDSEGNTYQVRTLASGEQMEVLKNFPAPEELAGAVRPVAREAHLESLKYYWLLVFTLK